MIVNIQVVGKMYGQTLENKNGWTDGRADRKDISDYTFKCTDRRTDRRADRKDISDYTFKWRNPWCHRILVVIDTYVRMC